MVFAAVTYILNNPVIFAESVFELAAIDYFTKWGYKNLDKMMLAKILPISWMPYLDQIWESIQQGTILKLSQFY
jgi:hypothetical protein